MRESGKNEFIGKKSYEIAYALWRIAAHASEKAFADILRTKAVELIGFAADGNYVGLNAAGDSLQAIIKFAVDVNCISVSNAAILAREIGNLKAAISEIAAIKPTKGFNDTDIDIADIFSKKSISQPALETSEKMEFERSEHPEQMQEIPLADFLADSVNAADMEFQGEAHGIDADARETGKKAEMRQAAILERIRQNGDCRLADIQAILSDVSERTLRYDIESLVQQNLIERLGTGGRSVYYRAKPLVNEA